jgi:two-component system cell cycle sensor histidine kinase/response regulator CckA
MHADDVRLDAILEVLVSYALQNFAPRVDVSERQDVVDAIATGINLLGEELHGEIASRHELESAYARLLETQAQLLVAERFAAIGQLATDVAHELNNPATWVLLGLDTVRRDLERVQTALGPDASALVNQLACIDSTLADVRAGMERMCTVVNDLRTLAPTAAAEQIDVDLDDVVRLTCRLARPTYASVAQLVLDLGDVPPISVDRARVGQLVANLLTNAAHAIADGKANHQIVVTTRVEGDEVLLAVEDSGPGIPDELRDRVFEPFFTTKPADVGMGLGLSIVRKIVADHGGRATVQRSRLGGARVEVRLPAQPRAKPATTPVLLGTSAASRRARVLIIDDEELLLRALARSLEDHHEVVTAYGGDAALELLARDRDFDLVVCDLQMPGVDGIAVHDALARASPSLVGKLVMMSGGAVTPRARQFIESACVRVIRKPIDIAQLLAIASPSA